MLKPATSAFYHSSEIILDFASPVCPSLTQSHLESWKLPVPQCLLWNTLVVQEVVELSLA